MDLQARTQKIKELHIAYGFKRNDDGYEFTAVINDQLIAELESCENYQLPINSYFVGNKYLNIDELKKEQSSEARIQINTEALKDSGLHVYYEWTDFLAARSNLLNPPDSFLIISDTTSSLIDKEQGKIKHFLEVSDFLKIIIENADHRVELTSEIIEEIVFLHKTKIEIPILIDERSIKEGLDGFSIFKSLFSDSSHSGQKKSILKEVIFGLLNNISKNERLTYLLVNFGEFSKRINENYQLFVSEFSFDDVRKEYEESKRDYLTKLNDIFSSVQTKMLGIPISLAIASIKISPIIDITSFWTNFFLLIAVIIYSVMMFILISNQRHTLCAVKEEYQSQMGRLRHQYSEQYDSIKGIQRDLDIRHDFQTKCLRYFNLMLIGLLIFIIVLFIFSIPWNAVLDSIAENEMINHVFSFFCV